jgi:hypothetical protein
MDGGKYPEFDPRTPLRDQEALLPTQNSLRGQFQAHPGRNLRLLVGRACIQRHNHENQPVNRFIGNCTYVHF